MIWPCDFYISDNNNERHIEYTIKLSQHLFAFIPHTQTYNKNKKQDMIVATAK